MIIKKCISIALAFCLSFSALTITAEATNRNLTDEQRLSIPIESNALTNWPQGPQVSAESAILMEANTGTILYEKNAKQAMYPASTTKTLTALLTVENCKMSDTVTISHNSLFDVPADSSSMGGLSVGDKLSVEVCLYGLMLSSGNEIAYALGEHVAGGELSKFVDMMNQRAKELGCVNSHFVNPHGYHDSEHYTCSYDLALISREALKHAEYRKVAGTERYDFPLANDGSTRNPWNHHLMLLHNSEYFFENCTGGKTGFTSSSGSTLVTYAEKDGLSLICVVLNENKPNHWLDTKALFDYGFDNFQKVDISSNEKNFTLGKSTFFHSGNSIFGDTLPTIELNSKGYLVLPNNASFTDTVSSINFEQPTSSGDANAIANLSYTYNGYHVGATTIDLIKNETESFEFSTLTSEEKEKLEKEKKSSPISFIQINQNFIFILLGVIGVIVLLAIVIFLIRRSYAYNQANKSINQPITISHKKAKKNSKRNKNASKYKDLHF